MLETISVYFSPFASNASLSSWRQRINNVLFRSQIIYRRPNNIKELNRLLELDIEAKVQSIIVIGGDGSVNTLAQKLAYTGIGLLVVPGGTANDFAAELGHKSKIDEVLHSVRSNSFKSIDLININNQYMVTNGGIGIGSFVAGEINSIRKSHPLFKKVMKLFGSNIYEIFLIKELSLPNLKEFHFKIESKELNIKAQSAFILINNQSKLAGKFNIAPRSKNDDGHFNITVITSKNRWHLIQTIIKILRNQFEPDQEYTFSVETKSVKIACLNKKRQLNFFGDGEIFNDSGNQWDIKIEPKALKIFTKIKTSFHSYDNEDINLL